MDDTMYDHTDAPVVITIGLTRGDHAAGYSPSLDGYRLGAAQDVIEVTIPAGAPHLTGVEWAEAAFVATNAPSSDIVGAQAGAALLWQALAHVRARGTRMRSLSVGDTVTFLRVCWACGPTGWELAEPPASDSEPQDDEPHFCESRCCTFAPGCAGFRDDNPGFWAPGEEAAERAAWAREEADRRRYDRR